MLFAIFGITDTALNVVVTLLLLVLVAVWIAMIVFTFTDARRRISDPFLVGCATAGSFFPFIGTLVYTILRPPEFLDDVRERETEIQESEIRLRHLEHSSCRKCGSPVESDYIRCPACRARLKEPCPSCSKPVGLDWKVCAYCETTLVAPKRSSRSGKRRSKSESSSSTSTSRSSKSERPAKAAEKTDDARRRSSGAPSSGSRSSKSEGATEGSARSSRPTRRRAPARGDESSSPGDRGER